MKVLRKRIVAGILVIVMAISSMQLSSYTVYAQEEEGKIADAAVVAYDAEGKSTDEAVEGNKGYGSAAEESEAGADEDPEGSTENENVSGEPEDIGEADEKVDDLTDTDSGEEPDDEFQDAESQVDETEVEEQQPELNIIDGDVSQLESVVVELDNVYQFGGAPSRETSESDDPSYSIEAYSDDNVVDGVTIEEYIYQELLKRNESINIYSYGIDTDNIYAIFSGVINEHPDLYFVSSYLSWSYIGTTVTTITLSYTSGLDDAAFKKATLAALSSVNSEMSDLQKAIILHDYLAVNCEYDYDRLNNNTLPQESYSAYGVLVEHIAVCQGYALAYKYLLNQAGIECYMVTSEEMNHAWNMVKLDGKYYQVDVTWDDPVWDLVGRVYHSYMFCSDAVFQDTNHNHYNWAVTSGSNVVDYQAVDTTYDNAFWSTINSPIVLSGDDWKDCYYVCYDNDAKMGKINKTTLEDLSNVGTGLCDIGVWNVWNSSGFYSAAYSGLFEYNNRLYYNDMTSICSVAFDGTDKRTEFTADTTNGYIYGSALSRGKVLYSLHQIPKLTEKETVLIAEITIDTEEIEIPVESIALSRDTLTLYEDDTATLTATVTPDYATNPAVTWASSDTSIATVEGGKVTAVSEGECIITASAGEKSASCKVVVTVDDAIARGEYKENGSDLTWVIDKDGKLIVEGTGDFAHSSGIERAPWYSNRTSIKSAVINVTGMTDASYMFAECTNMVSIELEGLETSRIEDMTDMFFDCTDLESLNLSQFTTDNVVSMVDMFAGCESLISLDLSSFNTSNVQDMCCMFSGCTSLSELKLDNFNTTNVTDMSSMFQDCEKLETLDLHMLNTSNVTDMTWMFENCSSLSELDLSSFDTSKVTDMAWMFDGCMALTGLNLSSFNTSNVTDMGWMFADCIALTSLILNNFDMGNVTNAVYMLDGDSNLLSINAPLNLKEEVELPEKVGEKWYQHPGEVEVLKLPINLDHSVLLNRDSTPIIIDPYITVTKTKTEYECGDTINLDDLKVVYYSSDGTSSDVTNYTTNVSSIDMSTPGTKELVVTYNNGTTDLTDKVTLTVTSKSEQGGTENKSGLDVKFKYPNKTYIYTGRAITPEIEVKYNGISLTEGVDYTVKYSNNIKANTDAAGNLLANAKPAQLTVTGKGNYTGSKSQTFPIVAKCFDNSDYDETDTTAMNIEGDYITVIEGSKISPVLFYGGVKLTTKDYKFEDDKYKTYKWQTEDNGKEVIITGQGNFQSSRKLTVRVISKAEQKNYKVAVTITDSSAVKNITYNGEPQKIDKYISVSTKNMTEGLIPDADYKIYYPDDITSAGTKKVTIVGISERCTGTVTKSYTIKPKKADLSVEFDKDDKGYTFVSTGTTVDDLVVKDGDTTLEKDRDYKVTYSKNKKAGTGKLTVTGLGSYKGSKVSETFTINPAVLCNNEQSTAGVTEGLEIALCDKVFKKLGVYKSAPYVSINGVLIKASNYTVTYYLDNPVNNPNARIMDNKENRVTNEGGDTTIWVMIKGKGNYATTDTACYATASYKVRSLAQSESYDLSKAKVAFQDNDGNTVKKVSYTGRPITENDIKVVVTYKIGGDTVILGSTEYEVEFVNNVNKGKVTVVITGEANQTKYVGSKTASFSIVAGNITK